jgi:hypothetical protein
MRRGKNRNRNMMSLFMADEKLPEHTKRARSQQPSGIIKKIY